MSVETNKWNEDDQINFSHARARRLPAEVLYDAIYRATGATSSFAGVAPGSRAATLPDVGVELPDGFLGNLGRPARESACECERSSNLQLGPVMALVSGPTVGNAISDPENAVAKMVLAVKDNSEVVKSLFLRFLNRPGKPDEVAAATSMFDQLEEENAKLDAELTAYEKELGPKLAQKEIDRQNRIAGLQTELEAYREIAKLRGPRADKERQDRIAKAQAAIAANDKKLMARLPKFEANQKKKTRWYPLEAARNGRNATVRKFREPGRWVDFRRRRQSPRRLPCCRADCRSIRSPAFASTHSPTTASQAKDPAAAPTATSSLPSSPPICCRRQGR